MSGVSHCTITFSSPKVSPFLFLTRPTDLWHFFVWCPRSPRNPVASYPGVNGSAGIRRPRGGGNRYPVDRNNAMQPRQLPMAERFGSLRGQEPPRPGFRRKGGQGEVACSSCKVSARSGLKLELRWRVASSCSPSEQRGITLRSPLSIYLRSGRVSLRRRALTIIKPSHAGIT